MKRAKEEEVEEAGQCQRELVIKSTTKFKFKFGIDCE